MLRTGLVVLCLAGATACTADMKQDWQRLQTEVDRIVANIDDRLFGDGAQQNDEAAAVDPRTADRSIRELVTPIPERASADPESADPEISGQSLGESAAEDEEPSQTDTFTAWISSLFDSRDDASSEDGTEDTARDAALESGNASEDAIGGPIEPVALIPSGEDEDPQQVASIPSSDGSAAAIEAASATPRAPDGDVQSDPAASTGPARQGSTESAELAPEVFQGDDDATDEVARSLLALYLGQHPGEVDEDRRADLLVDMAAWLRDLQVAGLMSLDEAEQVMRRAIERSDPPTSPN